MLGRGMSQVATVDGCPVFSLPLPAGCGSPHVTFFRSDLDIDVDGSPRAYGPGNLGEDYTANAGRSGSWWGIVTGADGKPIIQGAHDPAPGFYVSTTSLQDPEQPRTSPLRYVDADEIPFIVLPGGHFAEWGIKLGDLAWVQKLDGGVPVAACAAIFADAGPRDKLGEGSPALARALGINPDPKRGGTSSKRIQFYVFAGSGTGRPMSGEEIDARVRAKLLPALRSLGGLSTPIRG